MGKPRQIGRVYGNFEYNCNLKNSFSMENDPHANISHSTNGEGKCPFLSGELNVRPYDR